jgi:glycopeptide antibiotics resistance protein
MKEVIKSDITDLITNSLGGIMGIGVYNLIIRNFNKKGTIDVAIISIAVIVNVLLLGLFAVLVAFNH